MGKHLLDVLGLAGDQACGALAFLVVGDLDVVLAWELDLQKWNKMKKINDVQRQPSMAKLRTKKACDPKQFVDKVLAKRVYEILQTPIFFNKTCGKFAIQYLLKILQETHLIFDAQFSISS